MVEVLALNLLNMASRGSGASASMAAGVSGGAGAGAMSSASSGSAATAAATEAPAWQPLTPLAGQIDGMGKSSLGRHLLEVLRAPRGSPEQEARLAERLAYELDCGPWREGATHVAAALADPRPHSLVLRILLAAFPAAEPMLLALNAGAAAGLRNSLHLRMRHDVGIVCFEDEEESLDKSVAFAIVQAARLQADPAQRAVRSAVKRNAINDFAALPAAQWHTAAGAVRQLMAEAGGAPVVLVLDGMGDLPNLAQSYPQFAAAKERLHARSYGSGSSGGDGGRESFHQAVWSEFARILRELQSLPGCFVLCIGSSTSRSTVAQLERSGAIATRPVMLRPMAVEDVLASTEGMTFSDGPSMQEALRVREDLLPALAAAAVRLTAGMPELVRELLLRRVSLASAASSLTLPTATPAAVHAAMAVAMGYVPHAFGMGGGNTQPRWERASRVLHESEYQRDSPMRLLHLLARAQVLGVTFSAADTVRVPRLNALTAAAGERLERAAAAAAAAARPRRWFDHDNFDWDDERTGASHAAKRRRGDAAGAGRSRGAGAGAASDGGDDEDDDNEDEDELRFGRGNGAGGRKPARINLVEFATELGVPLVPAPGGRIAVAAGGMWLNKACDEALACLSKLLRVDSGQVAPSQPYAALRLLEAREQAVAEAGSSAAPTTGSKAVVGLLQQLCLESMTHKWAHTTRYYYGKNACVGDVLPVLQAAGISLADAVVSKFNITTLPLSRSAATWTEMSEFACASGGAGASARVAAAAAPSPASPEASVWQRAEGLAPGSLAVIIAEAASASGVQPSPSSESTVGLLLRVAEGTAAFSLQDSEPVSADSVLRLLAGSGLCTDAVPASGSASKSRSKRKAKSDSDAAAAAVAGACDEAPHAGPYRRVLVIMGSQLDEELREAIGGHAAAVVGGAEGSGSAAASSGSASGGGDSQLAVCHWRPQAAAAAGSSVSVGAAASQLSRVTVAHRIASAVPAGVELVICNPHAPGGGPLGGMIGTATLQDVQRIMMPSSSAGGSSASSAAAAPPSASAAAATGSSPTVALLPLPAVPLPITVKILERWMMTAAKKQAEAEAVANAAKAKAEAAAAAAAAAARKAKEEEAAARRRAGHIDMEEWGRSYTSDPIFMREIALQIARSSSAKKPDDE